MKKHFSLMFIVAALLSAPSAFANPHYSDENEVMDLERSESSYSSTEVRTTTRSPAEYYTIPQSAYTKRELKRRRKLERRKAKLYDKAAEAYENGNFRKEARQRRKWNRVDARQDKVDFKAIQRSRGWGYANANGGANQGGNAGANSGANQGGHSGSNSGANQHANSGGWQKIYGDSVQINSGGTWNSGANSSGKVVSNSGSTYDLPGKGGTNQSGKSDQDKYNDPANDEVANNAPANDKFEDAEVNNDYANEPAKDDKYNGPSKDDDKLANNSPANNAPANDEFEDVEVKDDYANEPAQGKKSNGRSTNADKTVVRNDKAPDPKRGVVREAAGEVTPVAPWDGKCRKDKDGAYIENECIAHTVREIEIIREGQEICRASGDMKCVRKKEKAIRKLEKCLPKNHPLRTKLRVETGLKVLGWFRVKRVPVEANSDYRMKSSTANTNANANGNAGADEVTERQSVQIK